MSARHVQANQNWEGQGAAGRSLPTLSLRNSSSHFEAVVVMTIMVALVLLRIKPSQDRFDFHWLGELK